MYVLINIKSEEDQRLKDELNMLVERLKEKDTRLYKPSLNTLCTLIRTSTSSMTSVPKPLKFLREHYVALRELYEEWKDVEMKQMLADVISVVSLSYSQEKRELLTYRLLGTKNGATSWGHEYVRHMAAEIGEEYESRVESKQDVEDLFQLAREIIPFFLSHNAEADAVDLLLELEKIDEIIPYVDETTFARVCLYMVSCAKYLLPPDDVSFLKSAREIYHKVNRKVEALMISLMLNDRTLIEQDYCSTNDLHLRNQMAFLLARENIVLDTMTEETREIFENEKLSEHFNSLGRELGISEPKSVEEILKTQISQTHADSRQNLSSSIVNALVNAGFKKDLLMMTENSQWIHKNKDHGIISAVASMGLIMLWDVEMGLEKIDQYLYGSDENMQAGALLAIGMLHSCVRNESDPAKAILSEHLNHEKHLHKIMAIVGLGISYAGTERNDISELLEPNVVDLLETSSFAALSLGFINVGTCNAEISSSIVQILMEAQEDTIIDKKARFMALGLGLLYLGRQDMCDAILESLKALADSAAPPVQSKIKVFQVLVEVCAYAGTGNVLKVQTMLQYISDHLKENNEWQAAAVLGVSLIAMGDELSSELALRMFNHIMHYGEPMIRRAVPLAIALLCASNPLIPVMDTLSKYSHDNDQDVAVASIFAMGLLGAGTNNARLAQMLRQLANYYQKNVDCLFAVRISQGLIHLGKGTISINPYHSNRSLLSRVGMCGLLSVILAMTDSKEIVSGKSHWMLYFITNALYPRFLITLDEDRQPKSVSVRVGQAVDVVGQAGRPKTITGFQTHNTPVLIAHQDRAELATEEYIALSPVLEGFVIIKKNPDYMETDKE